MCANHMFDLSYNCSHTSGSLVHKLVFLALVHKLGPPSINLFKPRFKSIENYIIIVYIRNVSKQNFIKSVQCILFISINYFPCIYV